MRSQRVKQRRIEERAATTCPITRGCDRWTSPGSGSSGSRPGLPQILRRWSIRPGSLVDGGRSTPKSPRRWPLCRRFVGESRRRIDHRRASDVDGGRSSAKFKIHAGFVPAFESLTHDARRQRKAAFKRTSARNVAYCSASCFLTDHGWGGSPGEPHCASGSPVCPDGPSSAENVDAPRNIMMSPNASARRIGHNPRSDMRPGPTFEIG